MTKEKDIVNTPIVDNVAINGLDSSLVSKSTMWRIKVIGTHSIEEHTTKATFVGSETLERLEMALTKAVQ